MKIVNCLALNKKKIQITHPVRYFLMKRFEAFSSFLDSDGAENCLKNPENFCLKDGILIFFLSLLEIQFHSYMKFF